MEEFVEHLTFKLKNMKCNGCVDKIKNHFSGFDFVKEIQASLENKTVVFKGENSLPAQAIRNELEKIGFLTVSDKC